MNIQKIEVVFDVSGKEENEKDVVLVVAGVLGEASQWREFSNSWQAVLTEEGVPIGDILPTFHTTDFMAKWQGYDDNDIWTEEKRNRLYNKLIDLINASTLYSVGIGILLDDYRKLRNKNPALDLAYKKVATFATSLAFWHCAKWAEENNYQGSISYIFDRGDTFRTEIETSHRIACKNKELRDFWRFRRRELDFKDKEGFVPIQAADLIAWELAKDTKEALKTTDKAGRIPRPELMKLITEKTDFKYYDYEDLRSFWDKFAPYILEEFENILEELDDKL